MSDYQQDTSFDINKSIEYKLSIQVSLDGFSFFILDVGEKRLVAWKKKDVTISNSNFIARRFREWMDAEEVMQQNYKQVVIMYFSPQFTIVPEKYHQANNNQKLFNLLFRELNNQKIVSSKTGQNDKILFTLPDELAKLFDQQFRDYSFYHPVQALLKGMEQKESKLENKVAAWIGSKDFYLVIVRNKEIRLSNIFNYSAGNDILYYTISASKQSGISPKQSHLFLSGKLDKVGDLVVKLNTYFAQVDYMKPNSDIKFNPEKVVIPKHQLISLF